MTKHRPTYISGRRFCPASPSELQSQRVRTHVRFTTRSLRVALTRQHWSACYESIVEAAIASQHSKVGFLAIRLQQPGLPVHLTLNCVAISSHRAALASFLCADWFFGEYTKNYYAKSLLPRTVAHIEKAREGGVAPKAVCMCCWHLRRLAVLEDAFHVVCTREPPCKT